MLKVMSIADEIIDTFLKDKPKHLSMMSKMNIYRPQDREEILSLAAVKILNNTDKYIKQENAEMSSWVYVIVRNIAYDYLRSLNSRPKSLELFDIKHPSQDTDIYKEDRIRLINDIDNFIKQRWKNKPHYFDIFTLRREGIPFAEIAEKLNMNGTTVRVTWFKTQRIIYKQFKDRWDPNFKHKTHKDDDKTRVCS